MNYRFLFSTRSVKLGCKRQTLDCDICIFFLDSPMSLTYKQSNSTIVAPLHKPVNISMTVKAYPVNVSFQWYFKSKDSDWMLINSSDVRFSVKNTFLQSVLTINRFNLKLQGNYRVNVWNYITDIKMFSYTLRREGITLK